MTTPDVKPGSETEDPSEATKPQVRGWFQSLPQSAAANEDPQADLSNLQADDGDPEADVKDPPADTTGPGLDLDDTPADTTGPQTADSVPPADISEPEADTGTPPKPTPTTRTVTGTLAGPKSPTPRRGTLATPGPAPAVRGPTLALNASGLSVTARGPTPTIPRLTSPRVREAVPFSIRRPLRGLTC
jgi:hypothetical protein